MARVNLDRFYDTNPQDAVSGNVLPSAGRQFARHSWGAQLNGTSIVSSAMVNEARLDFQQADPVTSFDPLSPSTQFTRAGAVPFTSGESRFVARVQPRHAALGHLTWTRGRTTSAWAARSRAATLAAMARSSGARSCSGSTR